MLELLCKRKCCLIKFCPLVVAFARTLHSFQGHEAGPGKPIENIIVNPGNKGFEALNPGTLYCCVTRASTLGLSGIENSALYFTGAQMCTNRIQNLVLDVNGKKYLEVKQREIWTSYLKKRNEITKSIIGEFKTIEYNKMVKYIHKASFSLQEIDDIIEYHKKRLI